MSGDGGMARRDRRDRVARAALGARVDWGNLPVHPAAAVFPLLPDDKLAELAEDIRANGLQQPIILWRDNREEANGATGPFPLYLLDGRNRLAALKHLGLVPQGARTGQGGYEEKIRILKAVKESMMLGSRKTTWNVDTEPTTFVLSMNIRRRHLTAAQKREAIHAYIDAAPTVSNRQVARALGVSDPTVASVRAESDRNAKSSHSDHLPLKRAKQTLRDNPTLSQRQAAAQADVGQATVNKARKELEAAGEIPKRTTTPQPPKPKALAAPKPQPPAPPNRDLDVKRLCKTLAEHIRMLSDLTPDEVSDKTFADCTSLLAELAAALGRLRTPQQKAK